MLLGLYHHCFLFVVLRGLLSRTLWYGREDCRIETIQKEQLRFALPAFQELQDLDESTVMTHLWATRTLRVARAGQDAFWKAEKLSRLWLHCMTAIVQGVLQSQSSQNCFITFWCGSCKSNSKFRRFSPLCCTARPFRGFVFFMTKVAVVKKALLEASGQFVHTLSEQMPHQATFIFKTKQKCATRAQENTGNTFKRTMSIGEMVFSGFGCIARCGSWVGWMGQWRGILKQRIFLTDHQVIKQSRILWKLDQIDTFLHCGFRVFDDSMVDDTCDILWPAAMLRMNFGRCLSQWVELEKLFGFGGWVL